MKKYLVLLILALTTLISACAHQSEQPKAWLTKQINIKLPSPKFNQPYHDQQLLKFKYHNHENSIITLVDANQNQLKVVALSALGVRLFELEYDGKNVKTKQNIFVKELPPPEQVLSDILFSILPTKEWQSSLPKGWILVDNEFNRILSDDKNEPILTITYQEKLSDQIRKPIRIEHQIFGYQIIIQSMDTAK
ncbi:MULTISPECIES: DUF3261 domain-containing protein [unclassified Gilliamella]|uniref:DUF3261 domain-containing protein n=1 Tax=unclassified Gilliamella TaxID=2685620 RepID=UPI00226A0613|nr:MULTISPECIES: DUF3261 domain-containing protein [unclassified Gilliamella]MCX8573712.1 DUF3261 domain-containing protein [Gilliamella sp. B3831]MCX8575660.1 DUF3261 domain-containing protein [Gilliamella sp. B3815]MCX8578133.1 DUF3261 domain-containing protein [Gilliamella sp. B2717]MCX8586956.1 DUF3261 domain-containing protein [Gilliamella sp. B3801]MCX8589861.1 DUF3261 domain-containing protein [Gilliamella sp. B3812]